MTPDEVSAAIGHDQIGPILVIVNDLAWQVMGLTGCNWKDAVAFLSSFTAEVVKKLEGA